MRAPVIFVAATANPHKLTEMRAALAGLVTLLPRPDGLGEVPEDGDTLEANARTKAVAVAGFAGAAALADDTGLEVDALGGAPGVHSARYAGSPADDAANVRKMLEDLAEVPRGGAAPAFGPSSWRTGPTGGRSWRTGPSRDTSPSGLAASAVSVTTPSSCRRPARSRSPR